MEQETFLPMTRVLDIVGLSRTTIWRLERAGDFPRSIALTPGRKAYRETEVRNWMAEKADQVPA